MKKILLLITLLMLSTFSVYANVSDWAEDDFAKAEKLGFISDSIGITDFTQSISREKFCEIGYDFLRCCVRAKVNHLYPADEFTDTQNRKILYLANAGVIAGRGDGIFAPDDLINREEAAAILSRMAMFIGDELPSAVLCDYYSDFDEISDWARGNVSVMNVMGVMSGVSSTEFSPKTTYTAEQAVSTMVRLFEYYENNLFFIDGELKADADLSVKYNSSFAWVENNGTVLHRCDLSEYFGYFCYFEGSELRIAILSREGYSEVYDSSVKTKLFTVRGKLVSAGDFGLSAELDDKTVNYDFSGNEIQ